MRHLTRSLLCDSHYRALCALLAIVVARPSSKLLGEVGPPITFGPAPHLLTVDEGPTAITTADFNEDGIPDIASANLNTNTISVLLGRGGGLFERQRRFSVPANNNTPPDPLPSGIAAADFDRDGHVDLAVVYQNLGEISIFRGEGNGDFQPPQRVALDPGPATAPRVQLAVAAGDFNRDGYPDLAVASVNLSGFGVVSILSVLINDRMGGFKPQRDYQVPNDPDHTGTYRDATLIAFDVDGDGIPDLVMTNMLSSKIWFFRGTASGDFAEGIGSLSAPGTPSYTYPTGVALGDVDGDGKTDAVVSFYPGRLVSVLIGDGHGSFRLDPSKLISTTTSPGFSSGTNRVALVDLNADGKLDVAVTNGEEGSLAILYGTGKGDFGAPIEARSGLMPSALVTADFDGDGRPDLVVGDSAELIGLYLSGDASERETPLTLPATGGLCTPRLVSADVNGDGYDDLLVGDGSLWFGLPRGLFAAGPRFIPNNSPPGTGTVAFLASADINHDGKPDLVYSMVYSRTATIALGRGDGTFESAMDIDLPMTAECETRVALVDVNGDGNLDLVLPGPTVFLGNGHGGFGSPISSTAGGTAFALADFNGDGIVDIVSTGPEYPSLSVALGTGDGHFVPANLYPLSEFLCAFGHPQAVAVGDFDGDGYLDIAVAILNCFGLIFHGRGDGSLEDPLSVFAGERSRDVVAADFAGDGHSEMAFLAGTDLRVFRYDGSGQVDESAEIARELGNQLIPLNIDSDNITDLAISSCDINQSLLCKITVLRNTTYGPERSITPVHRPHSPRTVPRASGR